MGSSCSSCKTIHINNVKNNLYLTKKNKLNKHLIVDDNPNSIFGLKKFLVNAGYKVDCVSNGLDAIKLTNENKYDMIWMDVKMPKMNGLEASKKIMEQDKSNIIIIITGFLQYDDPDKYNKAGAFTLFPKPVDIEAIENYLKLLYSKYFNL